MKRFTRPPSLSAQRTVAGIMGLVLFALIPGVLAHSYIFGPGIGFQIAVAVFFALGFEALMLKLRHRPLKPFLTDLSAPLTAVLFALCIPPIAPWWIAAIGMFAAIVLAKQFYGGLGYNLFNPAMVGYAVVLVCFSQETTDWPQPHHASFWQLPGLTDNAIFYVAGGLFLLWKKVIPWQIPVATLGSIATLPWLWWVISPNSHSIAPQPIPSIWVLTAFFIATDPVSGCSTPRGRLIFGSGVGILALLLHRAEGIAFAVLIMNCAAPFIDLHVCPNRASRS